MNQHYDLYHHHGGLGMLSFSAPVSCHTDTRGEGVFTPTDHTYPDLPSVRGRRRPPVLPSLKQLHPDWTTDTEAERRWHRALFPSPEPARSFPPRSQLPAFCLRCLPAKKSDAVIAPCAADREPLSPPAPPPGSSLAGCRGGSADVEPATQRSSAVGKHRRRRWNVFPVTSRTSSALRAPSSPPLATPKVRVGRRWGLVTGCELPTLSVWHECSGCSWHTQDQQGYMCAEVRDRSSFVGLLANNTLQICHCAWSCGSHSHTQGLGRC